MYDVYIRNSGIADSYFWAKACWWNHQLHPGLAVKWSVNRRWSASGFAIALIIYKNKSVEAVSPVVAGGMDEDE